MPKNRTSLGALRSNRIAWPLAAVVLALATLACGGQATPALVERTTAPPATEAVPTTSSGPYRVGDVVTAGDVIFVVVGWDFSAGGEMIQPEPGTTFVGIDVVLVNADQAPISLTPLTQMKLKDGTGQQYTAGIGASAAVGAGLPNGEVSPGERIRGQVGFPVSQDATGLTLVVDTTVWKRDDVTVDLGEAPQAVAEPGSLPGQQPQPTYAVGETVEIDGREILVNGVSYPAGGELTQPMPGRKHLVVDVTLANTGPDAITVSILVQLSLKDGTGQVYDPDLVSLAASGGTWPDGDLSAGETVRGQIGFQVAQDAADPVLVYDPDAWGFGKVFVALP